ncbi:MAG: ATP-binding protein [Rhodobacteraceae bacterium]|nr:ATP-binding protein [Paracoccaceae bacterium]
MDNIENLFERRLTYPDPVAQHNFLELVGIDQIKNLLTNSIGIFLNPKNLEKWGEKYHQGSARILDMVLRRPPLIILSGDVGTGKTHLAESIGDPIARKLGINITLLPLSLSARGMGRVGEMTKLISSAFEYTLSEAEKYKDQSGQPRAGIILLVDEADALAQSREMAQMHHEDKAGVNAFIRGIDRIAKSKVPAVVILCTNRLSEIDPAVKRRAAEIIEFSRPTKEQAEGVLDLLTEVGLTKAEISYLAEISVSKGFTYSDLTQRLIPAIIISAFPDKPVIFEEITELLDNMLSTPAFKENKNEFI